MRGARDLRRAGRALLLLVSLWSRVFCAVHPGSLKAEMVQDRFGAISLDDRTCRHLHGVSRREKTRNVTHALCAHVVLLSVLQVWQLECFAHSVAPVDTHSHRSCLATFSMSQVVRHMESKEYSHGHRLQREVRRARRRTGRRQLFAKCWKWDQYSSRFLELCCNVDSNLTLVQLRNHVIQDRSQESTSSCWHALEGAVKR